MTIHSDFEPVPTPIPGIAHRTLAGAEHGLTNLAVWFQRIDAGGATPPHRHDCEEVVIVQQGEGTLLVNGAEQRFKAGDTLILPRNELHQILNTGAGVLQLLAAFSAAPVQVELPDGMPLALPWQ